MRGIPVINFCKNTLINKNKNRANPAAILQLYTINVILAAYNRCYASCCGDIANLKLTGNELPNLNT
jgi:hypothetical protein